MPGGRQSPASFSGCGKGENETVLGVFVADQHRLVEVNEPMPAEYFVEDTTAASVLVYGNLEEEYGKYLNTWGW